MAIHDAESIKTLYTEYANEQDVCEYCKKELAKRLSDKKISLDDYYSELRRLEGRLLRQKVVKHTFRGASFCICKDCIKKAYDELFPSNASTLIDMLDISDNVSITPAVVTKEIKGKTKSSKKSGEANEPVKEN